MTLLRHDRIVPLDILTAYRYTAGPRRLPPGALVRFSVPRAFSQPQTDDPQAPGYTTVEADVPVTILRVEPSVESHEKTDIICRLDQGLQPGRAFQLHYHTERTYIFTGTFHEVDRRYWYSKLPPLASATALSEEHPFVAPLPTRSHSCTFAAGPPERLHLFLPGRRFTGEALTVRGTYTDRYRNSPPSGPAQTDIELFLLDAEGRRSPLGSPQGAWPAPHRFEVPLPQLPPGVYRVVACPRGSDQVLAASNPLVPGFARNNPRGTTANEVLRTGAKPGFTGGGDCHEARVGFSQEDPEGQGRTPHAFAAVLYYRTGMTAALMDRRDRASLIDALRQRRTYATSGARILLEFSVSGIPMGQVGRAREAVCEATVHAVGPLSRVEIIRDGEVLHRVDSDQLDLTFTWTDPEPPVGECYYYLHVVQADGQQAWSSPVWVQPSETP